MKLSIHDDLIQFSKQCANAISATSTADLIQDGVTHLGSRLDSATPKDFIPPNLPVVSQVKNVTGSPFLFNYDEIAADIKWRPSPRADFDAEVMALCSFNEMLKLGDVVAGLMFMTPNQIYPEHRHSPQEVYFVLSGSASWLYGGNKEYQQQQPGDVIYNHPNDLHGMKTGNEALLAFYFLWGDAAAKYSF